MRTLKGCILAKGLKKEECDKVGLLIAEIQGGDMKMKMPPMY